MNILLILSNKKVFSQEYSVVPSISIDNQGIIGDEEMVENELSHSPPVLKSREGSNLDNKYTPTFKVEDSITDLYRYSGFDSRISPSQSIISERAGICWLIAMIENFKANDEFRKYIFENCKNKIFLKGLENVFKIHDKEISNKDFDSLVSIYTKNKPTLSSGNSSLNFLIALIRCCSAQETVDSSSNEETKAFFHMPPRLIGDKNKYGFRFENNMPLIQICIPNEHFKTAYLNVSKIFPPYKARLPFSDSDSDLIILTRESKFLILNFSHYLPDHNHIKNFKGLVIPKTLYLRTKTNQKPQYSLTSLTYVSKYGNYRFNNETAYVKRNSKWYHIKCEHFKENSWISRFPSFFKKPSLIDILNDEKKDKIIFDTAEHQNNMFISFLYYQIEE